MTRCPGTDALTTIASALEWDVEDGMRHLSSCAACAAQLHALQATHEAFEETSEVAGADVDRIMSAIAQQAEQEHTRGRRAQTLGDVIEALLAGATAVTVVSASGAPAPQAINALTFVIVASALFAYRVFFSSQSSASRSSSPSIQ
jgi:hypothetical protein